MNIERHIKSYKLPKSVFDDLINYLLDAEKDIAWDVEGFGSLNDIFIEIFEREPKK